MKNILFVAALAVAGCKTVQADMYDLECIETALYACLENLDTPVHAKETYEYLIPAAGECYEGAKSECKEGE
jgi:hypothetical protein